jgi:predicted AAA+ superfamily ATPase
MNYLLYASNAYLLYRVKRENIKKKEILKTLEKYYVVDVGFYNILVVDEDKDRGFLLENIVFLELLRRGYSMTIGNIDQNEVDFVCKRNGKKLYIQVSESILDEVTREREFNSLELIQDNYPKYILTMDDYDYSRNGIIHMNILDFLKDDDII